MSRRQREDIFHEDSSEESKRQEGEVLSEQEGQIVSRDENEAASKYEEQPLPAEELYDSSDEDAQRMENEKRKRQLQWRAREEAKVAGFSAEELLQKALQDVEKTNKRVMLLRKKNEKRMEDIEKLRMTQQAYLVSGNTHFRGSANEYPLLTCDRQGKTILHANYSLRVSEMRLGEFIQKNIKEQSSANYLNQVVKFENYAYQQRKKRRQHIE